MTHTASILRAARAYKDWTQEDLAGRSDVTQKTIMNVETGKTTPNERTLRKIREPLEQAGIVFTAKGFEYHENNIGILDDFMDVLNDAVASLKAGDEILFHCADESRNSKIVTETFQKMEKSGIKLRFTIEEGNQTITTNPENYRWIDKDYFSNAEVTVIYRSKYVKHVSEADDTHHFILVNNDSLAKAEKKQFEYFWKRGRKWAKDQTI